MPIPRSSPQLPNASSSGRSASPDEDDEAAWQNHHRHVTFRQIKKLSDAYVFSDPQDVIGSGAFSTVYRCRRAETSGSEHHSSPRLESGALRGSAVQSDVHPPRASPAIANSIATGSCNSEAPVPPAPLPSSTFAIKVIRRSKLSVTEKRAQLREVDREVCVIQQLQHTGCTAFVEALQTPDEFAIVMDLREGALDLAKYLRQFGPLAEDHAAAVVCQLLHTAQYLHRWFRVLHRDIKLENIILSPVSDDTEHVGQRSVAGGVVSSHASTGAGGQRGGCVGRGSCTASVAPEKNDDVAAHDSHEKSAVAGLPVQALTPNSEGAPSLSQLHHQHHHHHHQPLEQRNPPERVSNDTPTDDALQHLRRFGHVTLVDFGLARWLPPLPNALVVRDNRSSFSSQTQDLAVMNCPVHCTSSVSMHPAESTPNATPGCPSFPDDRGGGTLYQVPSGGHSAVAVSPISPVQFGTGHLPSFVVSPGSANDGDDVQGVDSSSDASTMIYVSCCGSDKYLAHEMLKWYVESSTGRGSRRCMSVEHATKLDVYAVGVVAYVLLSGCLPYSGRTKALLAQQQATSPLKMTSQHWTGISQEAKDFVASLLSMDVGKRPTPEKALSHPWLHRAHALCEKLHTVPRSLAPPSAFPQSANSRSGLTAGSTPSSSQILLPVPPTDRDGRFSPLGRSGSVPEAAVCAGATGSTPRHRSQGAGAGASHHDPHGPHHDGPMHHSASKSSSFASSQAQTHQNAPSS